MIRSKGHCNTMGTASTMAVVAEALGMTIPGFAGTPAADARLLSMSHETGRLIVDMVAEDRRPSDIMTRDSFLNAIVAVAAVGGSTNAVMHLLAIAGRLGHRHLRSTTSTRPGRTFRCWSNLQPRGTFLMDDLYRAGGVLRAARRRSGICSIPSPITVTGRPLIDYLVDHPVYDDTVIRPRDAPLLDDAGIAVLRGNLAPRGAIIKPAAATAELLSPRVRPSCSTASRTCTRASTTPTSTSPPTRCWCCAAAGRAATRACPRSATCRFREAARAGRARHGADQRRAHERDGVRHRHPARLTRGRRGRAARARPDRRHRSARRRARRLHLDVTDEELAVAHARAPASLAAYAAPARGWAKLYVDHVMQADTGADLDFLVGASGDKVSRESH